MTLTPRQREIADLYLLGYGFVAVASRMGMTQAALTRELAQIRTRLGVVNHRAMMVRFKEIRPTPMQDVVEACRQRPAQWWTVLG